MPKSLQIDQTSPLSPAELESRLSTATRWSLLPFQGSPFKGTKPLKGRVRADRVRVGLSKRDWWTLLQPVFRGRIEPTASGGSRLVGDLGIPPWLVWELRAAVLVVLPLGMMAAAWPLSQELGTTGLIGAGVFALVSVVATILGIGLQVSHAEGQLPELEATLCEVVGTTPPPSLDTQASVEGESVQARHRARQPESGH